MKSRTSFFNLTALRKNITRFAPVWALYLIGGLLIGLNSISTFTPEYGHGARSLANSIGPMAIINFLYAIIAAELLFGDLFNSRLCNALHAFPMRRESWFATHTAAGVLFSLVPNLIMSICFLPFMGEMWYISFLWLLGMTLEYVFFFGLAAFSAMCTGNRFAMAAVYALANFLSMIAYWFVMTFYEPLLYGLHIRDTYFTRFCPTVWISSETELVEFQKQKVSHPYGQYTDVEYTYDGLSESWWYLAILAVLGIALLGAALLLYRRRKLESAGDFVAFQWMKPIFSVVFTLSVGALFEIFGETFMYSEYIFLVVGIIVGYFTGQMLLQRTVRVFRKKAFIACAAIGGVLLLSILLTALDPLGITRWTPDPSKVEAVILSDTYYYDPETDDDPFIVTDPKRIEELVNIHALVMAGADEDYQYSAALHLTYYMSDGRVIERRYRYNSLGKTARELDQFFSSPEYILGYTDWDTYLSSIKEIYVEGSRLSGSDAQELVRAIRADCETGKMNPNRKYTSIITWVDVWTDTNTTIQIFYDCENTLDWLRENVPGFAY